MISSKKIFLKQTGGKFCSKAGSWLVKAVKRTERTGVRNMLVVLALFVCTSVCLAGQTITINGNVVADDNSSTPWIYNVAGNSYDNSGKSANKYDGFLSSMGPF